jgi:hypothetical protein
MSIEIARYQFHSWARKGIANNITESDDLGAGTSAVLERAEVPIGVSLNGSGLSKTFSLVGPGDIVGIHRDMVVRTEPLNWIADFEGNYLSFIEFYDEDFAWRYTPAASAGTRLRPWLFLLVLKEDEFERTSRRLPLPTIKLQSQDVFPPFDETWMWAHVHSNADIPDSDLSDYERFLLSLGKTMNDDPDQLYCRLMSPRKLEPNTAYSAFVIPAFETGRLAGLELPTATINAQLPSWDANGAKGEMPVYYEWFFRTGVNADFESLVRLLEPRPMDPRVGIRDMDCHRPDFVKADGSGELPGTKPELIGLEGALKSPSTVSTVFPQPPTETTFQQELQKIVNLPFEIVGTDVSGDPVISIPLYGGKHAKKSLTDIVKLDITKSTWVHDLNRDPRTRVSAGFGTRVMQENQEYFMRKAWEQVTKVIEANRRIRLSLLYMKVAIQFTVKTFATLPQNKLLAMSKSVLARVMGSPTTILQQIRDSRLPAAVFSGAFRCLVRPNGKFARKIGASRAINYDELVSRINAGDLTAAPPKATPAGMPNTQDFANRIFPSWLPAWLVCLIKHSRRVLLILLVLLLLIALVTGLWLLTTGIAAALAALAVYARKLQSDLNGADSLQDPQREAAAIPDIPMQPNFTLTLSDEAVTPTATPGVAGAESVEAQNFRGALTDLMTRLTIQIPQVPLVELSLSNAYQKVSAAIHPARSFPYRLSYFTRFPDYIPLHEPEKIFEAMAYPDFEDAMYRELVEISGELMLPNLKLIPANTISLLKTNQKFIESYLVGLNHEMGRELLWREYPTDERGSYFRQFWEVKGVIRPNTNKTEAQLTEEYKDIKPIHTWDIDSLLGRHNNRDAAGVSEQTVLLLRGDLLKRYPNTVIFAQKAIAGSNADEPVIDLDLTAQEYATQVKFPLYRAELPPDIKLFGFDLTIEQARGTELTPGFTDHLGWFFIIQEVPGEPRFGMDLNFAPGTDGLSWDDLAWDRLPPDTRFIKASVVPNISVADKNKWGADSANMAYVLFQKPSMVAVHAQEMLQALSDT